MDDTNMTMSDKVHAQLQQEFTASQPEQETPVQEPVQAESAVKQETKEQESVQAKNFRTLRESKEKAERERDELFKRVQEIERQQAEKNKVDPDDLVEARYVDQKIKMLEEQVLESKIKQQYPDFDTVVSKENIELLKNDYPEIAYTLNTSSDLYSKAVTAYTLIKKLDINKTNAYKEEKEKVQANASKPRPLTSISPQQGESPLSHANAFANGLTEELKAQLRKEMTEARKGY